MDGYVLVATGASKYFSMAAATARSIKYFDGERGICLACDSEKHVMVRDRPLFDHIVQLPHAGRLRGTEHHLYLNKISPFARTIYIDADCLLASSRIHEIWKQLEDYHVTFPGRKITEGTWRMDITDLRRKFGIDYVVQLSGGVFYFDKSEESDVFFATAQGLFENRQQDITRKHNTGGGLANEPIWGVTMALREARIFPLNVHLNVSTLRTENWEIDSKPSIRLRKDGAVWSPVICHFLGLGGSRCPNDLYRAFAALTSQTSQLETDDRALREDAEAQSVAEKALADAQQDLAEARARTREVSFDRDRQSQEIGDLVRLLREAEEQLSRVQADRRAMTKRSASVVENQRLAAVREVEGLTQRLIEAERQYNAVVRSSSWRLTAPLRRVVTKMRGTQDL